MALKLEVPFYSNTPDDYHCYQAAFRMVLAYYMPNRTYTWEELDVITAHTRPYTWPLAGTLYCISLGFQVLWIETFDYRRFSKEGYSYILETYGKEVADAQLKNSDIPQETSYAAELIQSVNVQNRVPTWDDLEACLLKGYLPICNVNSRVLSERSGYAGHSVVITGISEDGVWLHDPGLPPVENRFISCERFDKAWAYPNEQARNVTALRLPQA
jgi:hypothetical protein